MKKWQILSNFDKSDNLDPLIQSLLKNRGIATKQEIQTFIDPPNPQMFKAKDVGIDGNDLKIALKKISQAIKKRESIVVYADYDADGISAGAIVWETIHSLGGNIMPYIPHRVEEGYGLSVKGIDFVKKEHNPALIITVDHGITAREKVDYASKLGIEVIVTDHHVKPSKLPQCPIVHTTKLSGSGVAWFLAKELLDILKDDTFRRGAILELATIGTIADMVPLMGPNRSITKWGLIELNKTLRVGIEALIRDAGLIKGKIGTYEVSHILAPRLNAMGRLEHALDALRLLVTKQTDKAATLARKLQLTNQERQQLTTETTTHALRGIAALKGQVLSKKLLFVSSETYNQGVIGLVAGKLVEEYWRPAIVISQGEVYSKASARSINGFNIVEAIRSCSDILVDVGGHPMAAGFTVETKFLNVLQERLESFADRELNDESLTRTLRIDAEIPLDLVTFKLWEKLSEFEPFGFGNPEPVFATNKVQVIDMRTVGNGNKHLKMRLSTPNAKSETRNLQLDAIAFGMGELYGKLTVGKLIDIVYSVNLDTWNGNRRLQLKVKDIHI